MCHGLSFINLFSKIFVHSTKVNWNTALFDYKSHSKYTLFFFQLFIPCDMTYLMSVPPLDSKCQRGRNSIFVHYYIRVTGNTTWHQVALNKCLLKRHYPLKKLWGLKEKIYMKHPSLCLATKSTFFFNGVNERRSFYFTLSLCSFWLSPYFLGFFYYHTFHISAECFRFLSSSSPTSAIWALLKPSP